MSSPSEPAGEAKECRRTRRARETRQRILQAAVELFAERGVDGVTVEEIAGRADVARGTVFNYFATKETLCQGLGALMMDRLQEALEQGLVKGPSAADKIAQALRLMSDYPVATPDRFREMLLRGLACMPPGRLPEYRTREWALLETWVLEGQRNGEFRTDLPAGELAGFMIGIQFQSTLIWSLGFVEGSLPDHVVRSLALALEGVRRRD